MSVSLPDEIYSQTQEPATRPYYLGHHGNRVRPLNQNDAPPVLVTIDKERSNTSGSSSSSTTTRRTATMVTDQQQQDNPSRYYYYQPQRNLVLSSPSVNNTTTEESSSYYSSRCQIPHVESQRTISTMDSIFTGYPPIQFDLPIIQLGGISQMDISFLKKR